MADGQLRLDTNELIALGRDLRGVADEFHNGNDNSDIAAEAAGGGELGDAIRTFAHQWDDKRRRMVDDIAYLGEAAAAVGETFEALDRDFAATLRGER